MIGVYDFCGHYEWTFAWLEAEGGPELVRDYWTDAICKDSQIHASTLVAQEGFEGMKKYWGHTLDHEAAGYAITETEDVFRIDMHECPSKGFLVRNGLVQYRDYCDHCIGWIGPMMKDAGFVIDHEHNHCGQCWWEIRKGDNPEPASLAGALNTANDVRLRGDWKDESTVMDRYVRATSPDDKATSKT